MDTKTLKYFTVIAEELNITRASKILHISQPPLSNQIKNLENELNTTLFKRSKKGLELTEEGKYLYQKAKDILSLNDKTKNDILLMNKGFSGTISLGLVEGISPSIISNWIYEFMNIHKNIRFRIINGNSDDLIEKMRLGHISMAVISAPFDANLLNNFKIYEERMVVLLNKEHRLANNKVINIQELENEKLIVPNRKAHIDNIRKWFRKINLDPNIICEMDNYIDAAQLTIKNVGISLFPKTDYIHDDNLIFKELENIDNKIDYLFVWRKGHQLSSLEENFIDYVKSLY